MSQSESGELDESAGIDNIDDRLKVSLELTSFEIKFYFRNTSQILNVINISYKDTLRLKEKIRKNVQPGLITFDQQDGTYTIVDLNEVIAIEVL